MFDLTRLHRGDLLAAVARAVRTLPRGWTLTGAQACGWAGRVLSPAAARARRAELERRFPGRWTAHELDRIVAATFSAYARMVADALALLHRSRAEVEASIARASGWEHLASGGADRPGRVLLSPHHGHWELGAAWISLRGIPLTVTTATNRDPAADRLRESFRRRFGVRTLRADDPRTGRALFRRLRLGEAIALLPDRDPAGASRAVRLAALAGARLHVVGCAEIGPGRYAVHVGPAVSPAPPRDAVREIERAFAQVLTNQPEQWYNFAPAPERGRSR